ncbi:MAG: glutamate--tRNA ligase [bacterium]|nr:glutamate--tRNA ligase [bacterium]
MTSTTPVRVRFAPSPSGYLHTGGARTALFNWLWARKTGGQFVLRVEDTDENRSTAESTHAILESLLWLGIDWDEGPDPDPARFGESVGPHGPYFQSMRADRHRTLVMQLVEQGKAYFDPAEAEEWVDEHGKKKLFGPRRDIAIEEQRKLREDGRAMPVRFKCPHDVTVEWNDIIRGPVSFQSGDIGDFVILKSNGSPLYNFAVTCDDADMRISHVLRGEDHISNTPKQLLLYRALGLDAPVFGHVPLIVGMDRARLSKRHGATRCEAYREEGYLPDAMVNFLALIGWAPKDNHELFTSRTQLIEYFNPHDIVKSAGAFNTDKLDHFNGLYIRGMSPDEFFAALRPFVPQKWIDYRGDEYAKSVCVLYQEKLVKFADIVDNAWYFFEAPIEVESTVAVASVPPSDGRKDASATDVSPTGAYNPAAVDKLLLNNADAPTALGQLYAQFDAVSSWDAQALEATVDAFCEGSGLGRGKVMQPWRVALTGDKMSPGFYDVLVVLGKDEVLSRAKPWVERLKNED